MSSKIEVAQELPLTKAELARRIQLLPPHEQREAINAASVIYMRESAVWRTPAATELENRGWEPWLTTLAPHIFYSQFEDFDRKFWDWYWMLLLAKREGKRLVDLNVELAYLYTLARGLGKSSSLEWAFIALGAIMGRVLGLYVSSTSTLAEGHLNNIREELESPLIGEYYPGLANPEVGKFNNRYGWTASLLATRSGLTIFAAGLQEEVRGLKRRQLRPALIGADEFDGKTDTPDVVKKKEAIIGGSIFGTQTSDTIIILAQNLIHARSVADRTYKRQNQLLSFRRESGLIRAFSDDLELEMVGTRWFATKGHPLYARLDMAAFQKFLDTSGPIETYCHPAGTLVTTDDGLLPIENVKASQVVTTHTGALRKVTGTARRLFSGNLVLIRRAGHSGFVRATPEHRFYIARSKVSRSVFYKHRSDPKLLRYAWVSAQELRVGDYLVEPLPKRPAEPLDSKIIWRFTQRKMGPDAKGPCEIVASKELCRLIGYYLAEGSTTSGAVRFAFHQKETAYHDDVLTLGKYVFGCGGRVRPDHGRGVTVLLRSTIAQRFFDTFGKGAHHKFIPNWVFELSPDLCREILIGYMRGDGNKSKAGFAFATASLQLGEGIRRLMLYCNVASNLYKLPPRTLRLPQGSMFTRGDFWMGTINGREGVKLGDILGIRHAHGRNHSGQSFIHGGYLHARVGDVSALPVCSLPVYNLHVEDDHSYIAEVESRHKCEYQHRFDLDLEGKVFKNYNDLIHVITEEDFARVYGVNRPPPVWNKYLFNDKARTNSEFHVNAAGTLTMSAQNTRLPGITFLYDCLSFPAATEPEDCAVAMLKCITPTITVMGVTYTWEDLVKTLISRNEIAKFTKTRRDEIKAQREGLAQVIPEHVHPLLVAHNFQKFRMSHEADDWRAVYRDCFGLPFTASNPGMHGGTAMINLVAKVDKDVPDPFRRRLYDEQGNDIGPLMGMSRWYMIVKKEKLPYPNDAKPELLHGSDRARYQFTEQRYLEAKVTADGEKEGEPEKRNDDFFNGMQMFYVDHSIQARELTPGEMQDATLPAPLQAAVIDAEIDPEKKASNVMAREIALRRQAAAQITKQLTGGGGGRSKLSSYKNLTRKGR